MTHAINDAQRRMLESVRDHGNPWEHVRGKSVAVQGGATQTFPALLRKGLIERSRFATALDSGGRTHRLTRAGWDSLHGPLPEGLFWTATPSLPTAAVVRCGFCGCSVDAEHEPNAEDCRMLQHERFAKNQDD